MGWSLDKYRYSTLEEFNKASLGYWRNKERDSSLVRDIIFTLICGNPNIEDQNKPNSPTDLYKLSIDEEIQATKKKVKSISAEELEKIRQRLAKM